jgi:SAM-dependent methyltransferase
VAVIDDGFDVARRRAEMPAGAFGILDARSLRTSHRRLAELVVEGVHVLDVGCGTGVITRGIAERVGPAGRVVGLDVCDAVIADARAKHTDVPGLAFVVGDVYRLPATGRFDIVTAARVLQWLARPAAALRAMRGAVKPGGHVIVLDYNHERIAWHPRPPASVEAFYGAFLRWRADAGMDNAIADHLGDLFRLADLTDIAVVPQHETTERGDEDFETRAGIWAEVAATRGHQMVADGVISEPERAAAQSDYRAWLDRDAKTQTMYLLAVDGTRP